MTAQAERPDAALRATSVVRESRWLAASGVVVGLVNYAYSLLMTQLLAPRLFADFAAAQSLLLVCGTLATSSIPWVVARVLSEPLSTPDERHQVIWFSIVVNLLQGVVAAALLCVIGSRFLSWPSLLAVAAGTLAIFLTTTPGGWLQGTGRFDRLAFFRVLEVVVKLGVGAGLVLAGAQDTGALVGVAAGAAVVVVVGLLLIGPALRRTAGALRVKALWSASLGNVGVQGLVAVLASTDVVLVAVLDGGSAESGSYQAAAILGRVPVFLAGALGAAAFPTLVATLAGAREVRSASVAAYGWPAGAWAVALMTAPAAAIGLVFPGEYVLVDEVLPWVALSGVLVGLVNLVTTFFQAAARYVSAVRVLAVGVPAHVLLLLVGWWVGGLDGLAAASPVAPALVVVGLLLLEPGRLRRPSSRASAGVLVLGAAAVAVLLATRPYVVAWLLAAVVIGLLSLRLALRRPAAVHGSPL